MTDTFEMKAIGFVKGSRTEAIDDNWGGTTALIELADNPVREPLPSEVRMRHRLSCGDCQSGVQ